MEKVKRKNIFKTFALGFTSLALMLGVFLGNALPQVKAEEADELTRYYTAEKIEEIKISQVNFEDTEFYNKHILCDITELKNNNEIEEGEEEIAFFAIDRITYDYEYSGEAVTADTSFNLVLENNTVYDTFNRNNHAPDNPISGELHDLNYTYKYFVGGDSREYVYLYINGDEYFTGETFVIMECYSYYISEPIQVPKKPSNNRPITNDKTEEKTETGCGSFIEDVGVVVNEVLKIEDVEPFATGITTIVLTALVVGIIIIAIKK